MSAPFNATAEMELLSGLIEAIRHDPNIQTDFGTHARIFDDESFAPYFPFIQLDSMETIRSDSVGHTGHEHRLNFSIYNRDGGRAEAMRLLGVFRKALENASPNLVQQRIVLLLTTYTDVFRTNDNRKFRGTLRLRVITEEV